MHILPALRFPSVASTTPPHGSTELIDKKEGADSEWEPVPSRAACHVEATPPSERAPERIFGFKWPGQSCTHQTHGWSHVKFFGCFESPAAGPYDDRKS